MKTDYIITTQRLGLRNWLPKDTEPFIKMCQDKEVMKFFPSTLSKEETKGLIERMKNHFLKFGFCYFAVDILKTKEFIGFTGLLQQNYESLYTPCVDIGWRLKQNFWGNGYATEAAKACLNFAFTKLNVNAVSSFTPKNNKASEAIMKKIGMTKLDLFIHPNLLESSKLNPCLAYKINK